MSSSSVSGRLPGLLHDVFLVVLHGHLLALHLERGLLLLLQGHAHQVRQQLRLRERDHVVRFGELDGRDDDKVLPVDLLEGDALLLGQVLLLLLLLLLPRRPLDAVVDLARDGRSTLHPLLLVRSRPVLVDVQQASMGPNGSQPSRVGNQNLGVLLDELVEEGKGGVGRLQEIKLVVVALAGLQIRLEAATGSSGEQGGELDDVQIDGVDVGWVQSEVERRWVRHGRSPICWHVRCSSLVGYTGTCSCCFRYSA